MANGLANSLMIVSDWFYFVATLCHFGLTAGTDKKIGSTLCEP